MDLHISEASSLLVASYPTSWLRECWRKGSALDAEIPPVASDCLSLGVPEGRAFWRHLSFVWSEISSGAVFLQSETATLEIERTSAALLLLASENGAICSALDVRPEDSDPGLEKAESYILSHLSDQITLADLVTVAETSPSSLMRTFRVHRGTSPMKYVKQLRLESVQRELLAAESGTIRVADVAMKYGFFQLGRFSAEYRHTFGELPSETLGH